MLEIKKLDKSLVEIKTEIEWATLESFKDEALKRLGENLEVDGFRKGHAPNAVIEKTLGEAAVIEKMAEMAVSKTYPKIITEQKIDAIGYPQINITKLAKGNPLGLTIIVTVVPEIKLGDYKAIAREAKPKEVVEVTEKDLEDALVRVNAMRAKEENIEVANLPALSDEYVKKLGDFKDVADFKEKIKENIKAEKEFRAKDKRRLEIIESIMDRTPVEVPEILIHSESHKMLHKMRADIEGMGMKYDDYLKAINKTEEDLEKDFHKDAEKRAKLQLVVAEIAKAEGLTPDPAKVAEEVKKVTEIYKDADPENARLYIENVFTNEEVFKFLENQE